MNKTQLPARSFEEHYLRLLADSIERTALAELEFHRTLGHRRRAERAERRYEQLNGSPAAASSRARTYGAARVMQVAAVVALLLLAVEVPFFGVRSWWTGAADLLVVAFTFAWFMLDTRRGAGSEPVQTPPAS